MKTRLLSAALLMVFFLTACEVDDPAYVSNTPVATEADTTLSRDIDSMLSEVDAEIHELETKAEMVSADLREEFDETIAEIKNEREDLSAFQAKANEAASEEEMADARIEIRDELRDIQALLYEARIQAAADLSELRSAVETEMADVDAEITEVEAEAAAAGDELSEEYKEHLNELRSYRDNLQTSTQRLEQATEENWSEIRVDLVEGWRGFMGSLQQATEDVLTEDTEAPSDSL